MKKILILLAFISMPVFSQIYNLENETSSKQNVWLNNKIGFTYSMMTGYGLSYQRQLTDKIGLKSQFFAYGSIEDNPNSGNNFNDVQVTIGTELQYDLKKFESSRLYLLAGGFYRYMLEDYYYYDDMNTNNNFQTTKNDINVGLGFGFEFMLDYNFSASIDGGYHFNYRTLDTYDSFYDNVTQRSTIIPITTNPMNFGFAFGVSLFYNF